MKNQLKTQYIWIALIIVAVAGVLWMGYSRDGGGNLNAASATGWFRGGESAPVVLVEYSDFQCPACGAWEPYIRQFKNDYGSNIKVVYKQFPLPQHLNAERAAEASEAAGLQDKFWEMHDKLFDTQTDWEALDDPTDTFVGYASDLELDVDQFTTDIDSVAVKENVQKGIEEGRAVGVSYTPYFILNGEVFDNAQGPDGLKAAIEAAIADAGVTMGTSTDAVMTATTTSEMTTTSPAVSGN